ncbi:glycosyl hydrolase [Striga asiatica]|uniref:Glycosyl hydrolase n=1 Tax=Striga asiatica TaxID=4170 RepID=A0A5A7Q5B4_STRAF|nr:glycosyl hydrolase [Striga asiatica]
MIADSRSLRHRSQGYVSYVVDSELEKRTNMRSSSNDADRRTCKRGQKSKNTYSQRYGYTDRENTINLSPETLFHNPGLSFVDDVYLSFVRNLCNSVVVLLSLPPSTFTCIQ